MSDLARYAAIRALVAACGDVGLPLHAEHVRRGTARPYYLVYFLGGGERNQRPVSDANLLFGVKCVADTLYGAMQGAALLSAALNDKGTQDVRTGALNAGPDWEITTSTQELDISLVESTAQGAEQLYHAGFQLRLIMEEV